LGTISFSELVTGTSSAAIVLLVVLSGFGSGTEMLIEISSVARSVEKSLGCLRIGSGPRIRMRTFPRTSSGFRLGLRRRQQRRRFHGLFISLA